MGKGQAWANDMLALYFFGSAAGTVAQNAAFPFTSHIVALHTADPGFGGSQATHETAYGSYARQSVPRNSSGWTQSGNMVQPFADIEFPKCTTSPGPPITHWSISRGGGTIDYRGALDEPIVMATQVKPVVTTDSTITEE